MVPTFDTTDFDSFTESAARLDGELHRPERFVTDSVNGLTTAVEIKPGVFDWRCYVSRTGGEGKEFALPTEPPVKGVRLADRRCLPPPRHLYGLWTKQSRWEWYYDTGPYPNPADIFARLVKAFESGVVFSPGLECHAKVCALWVFMTYFTPLMKTVPYLHVNGVPGGGKTSVISLMQSLVFRPFAISHITTSALFRYLQEFGGTVLVDEAEKFCAASDIEGLMNAGYKRGTDISRAAAGGTIDYFNVFGPKLLASINPLSEALASRCIVITMVPANRRPAALDVSEAVSLRDALHVLAMDYTFEVAKAMREVELSSSILNRQGDLWDPLLGIASWLEQRGVSDLYQMILTLAEEEAQIRAESRVPCEDEAILRELYRLRVNDQTPTAAEVLQAAREANPTLHWAGWTAQKVGYRYDRYGLRKWRKKSNSKKVQVVPVDLLKELLQRHQIDVPSMATPQQRAAA